MDEGDAIRAGKSERIRVRVEYRKNITAEALPTEDTALELKFKVTYIQADETAHDVRHSGPEYT